MLILSNFCSVAAAERITGRKVDRVEEWRYVVFVRFAKGSPRFMSKQDFLDDAVSQRSDRAATAVVTPTNTWAVSFFVQRAGKPRHTVTLQGEKMFCTCKDWLSQWPKVENNQRICLHTLAVRMHMAKPVKDTYQSRCDRVEAELAAHGYGID